MDKNSVHFFMVEMTQKEFEEKLKLKPIEKYEFNKIKRINGIDKENDSRLEEK